MCIHNFLNFCHQRVTQKYPLQFLVWTCPHVPNSFYGLHSFASPLLKGQKLLYARNK